MAEIAQTVTEVLASPALFTNQLSLVMTTRVRIEHDPDDFRFPARARHYEVTLVYDEASKVAHQQSGEISPGRVDPIEVVFAQVPSGGKVTVDVVLTTEEGYIVGRSVDAAGKEGPVGPIDNTPEKAGTIVVPIKERLIPLTQATHYLHDLELKVENGRRVWAEGAAPTATQRALPGPGRPPLHARRHHPQPGHRHGRLQLLGRRPGRSPLLRRDEWRRETLPKPAVA